MLKRIVSLLFVLLLLSGSVSWAEETVEVPVYDPNDPKVITVSPFPYLTDVEKFKELVTQMWAEIEPDVELAFVDWSCYGTEPPTADVIMYDALYTTALIENGHIQPVAMEDIALSEDIMPFVLDGLTYEGELYGIPNLLCGYHIIYYQDDQAIHEAENLLDLYDAISTRKTSDPKPVDRYDALILNWDEYAYLYAEALVDATADPEVLNHPYLDDPDALDCISSIIDMVGDAVVYADDETEETFDIYGWFNDGYGRAFLGYSEALVNFESIQDQLTIKPISLSHQDNMPMYFVDSVSINTSVENEEKIEDCTKLLNLLASQEFIEALMLNGEEKLQFMMPVRESVWDTLRVLHPLYETLYGYASQEGNLVTRYGSSVYDFYALAAEDLLDLLEAVR